MYIYTYIYRAVRKIISVRSCRLAIKNFDGFDKWKFLNFLRDKNFGNFEILVKVVCLIRSSTREKKKDWTSVSKREYFLPFDYLMIYTLQLFFKI